MLGDDKPPRLCSRAGLVGAGVTAVSSMPHTGWAQGWWGWLPSRMESAWCGWRCVGHVMGRSVSMGANK